MLLLLLSALHSCWLFQSVAKMWRSCSACEGVGGVGGGAYGSGLTSPARPLDPSQGSSVGKVLKTMACHISMHLRLLDEASNIGACIIQWGC